MNTFLMGRTFYSFSDCCLYISWKQLKLTPVCSILSSRHFFQSLADNIFLPICNSHCLLLYHYFGYNFMIDLNCSQIREITKIQEGIVQKASPYFRSGQQSNQHFPFTDVLKLFKILLLYLVFLPAKLL